MMYSLQGTYIVPQTSIVFPEAFEIVNIVEPVMESGYGLTPTEIADVVDSQLSSTQKLYQIEILQASKLLADDKYYTPPGPVHPTGVLITFGLWADVLMEKLKWRIVPVAFCTEGKIVDPVTKVCISAPVNGEEITCPTGFELDPVTGMCLQVRVPLTCPTGYELDLATGMCLEIKAEKKTNWLTYGLIGIGVFMLMSNRE